MHKTQVTEAGKERIKGSLGASEEQEHGNREIMEKIAKQIMWRGEANK